MRVPPPYVPPLSRHLPDFGLGSMPEPAASAEPVDRDAADDQPKPENAPSPAWHQRLSFAKMTGREKIVMAFFLISLILIPTAMPPSSVDAQQINPSDPHLQPVERAEENFAGSAFYFIDPDYAVPKNYGGLGIDPLADPGAGSAGALSDMGAGDLAAPAHSIQPTAFRGSATDNSRALYCLAQAIYYEAGLEPDAGQRAVAQVILNLRWFAAAQTGEILLGPGPQGRCRSACRQKLYHGRYRHSLSCQLCLSLLGPKPAVPRNGRCPSLLQLEGQCRQGNGLQSAVSRRRAVARSKAAPL